MRLLLTAGNLDVSGWVRGLLSAGISGGASAISGGTVISLLDPTDFNIHEGKFYTLVIALFCANAVVSIAKFLQTQPIPQELKQVTTTVETVDKTAPKTIVTSTVQEVHTEVLEKK